MFTECVNKIALSLNDDKTVQSINSIETHVYGKNEEIIHKKWTNEMYQQNKS